jgi:hypothetical protein
MDRYGGPNSALPIALNRVLCLAIIMDRYGGAHSALNVSLHRGL